MSGKGKTKDKSEFPFLTGPYLGQKPPDMKPEVFTPIIVSVKKYKEYSCVFTSDGSVCLADTAITNFRTALFLPQDWKREMGDCSEGNFSSQALI